MLGKSVYFWRHRVQIFNHYKSVTAEELCSHYSHWYTAEPQTALAAGARAPRSSQGCDGNIRVSVHGRLHERGTWQSRDWDARSRAATNSEWCAWYACCCDGFYDNNNNNYYIWPRSFAVLGPTVWNTLPSILRVSTTTLGQFQSGLKTILFRLAYGTWLGAFVTV